MTKGRITLLATAMITTVALFFSGDWRSFLFTVGIAGLVGCATNALAIRMLFDRIYLLPWKEKWPLPCSGILEERRVEVAEGIGWVVSRRLLSPDTIVKNIGSESFQRVVNELFSEKLQQIAEDSGLLENLLQDIERGMLKFADSQIFRQKLQHALYRADHIEKVLGEAAEKQSKESWVSRVLSELKEKVAVFRDREKITPHVQKELKKLLSYLCSDAGFHEILKDFLKNLPQKFSQAESPLKEDVHRYGAIFLRQIIEKLEIDDMVAREVRSFPKGVLRDLMYRITAENLDWLEVWGGVLGVVGGAILWILSKWVYF